MYATGDAQSPEKQMQAQFGQRVMLAIQTMGMPEPQRGVDNAWLATPIHPQALGSPEWNTDVYGLPAYVKIKGLGACQLIARRDGWFAVSFVDVHSAAKAVQHHDPRQYHDILKNPSLPMPRWRIPWCVRSDVIAPVEGIVKLAAHAPDRGFTVYVLRTTETVVKPTDDFKSRLEVIPVSWTDAQIIASSPTPTVPHVHAAIRQFMADHRHEFVDTHAVRTPPLAPAAAPTTAAGTTATTTPASSSPPQMQPPPLIARPTPTKPAQPQVATATAWVSTNGMDAQTRFSASPFVVTTNRKW